MRHLFLNVNVGCLRYGQYRSDPGVIKEDYIYFQEHQTFVAERAATKVQAHWRGCMVRLQAAASDEAAQHLAVSAARSAGSTGTPLERAGDRNIRQSAERPSSTDMIPAFMKSRMLAAQRRHQLAAATLVQAHYRGRYTRQRVQRQQPEDLGTSDRPTGEPSVYYHVAGESSPSNEVTVATLCALVADGTINVESNIWQEGMDAWTPLSDCAELIDGLAEALAAKSKVVLPLPLPVRRDGGSAGENAGQGSTVEAAAVTKANVEGHSETAQEPERKLRPAPAPSQPSTRVTALESNPRERQVAQQATAGRSVLEQRRQAAAVTLQAHYRGSQARKRLANLRKDHLVRRDVSNSAVYVFRAASEAWARFSAGKDHCDVDDVADLLTALGFDADITYMAELFDAFGTDDLVVDFDGFELMWEHLGGLDKADETEDAPSDLSESAVQGVERGGSNAISELESRADQAGGVAVYNEATQRRISMTKEFTKLRDDITHDGLDSVEDPALPAELVVQNAVKQQEDASARVAEEKADAAAAAPRAHAAQETARLEEVTRQKVLADQPPRTQAEQVKLQAKPEAPRVALELSGAADPAAAFLHEAMVVVGGSEEVAAAEKQSASAPSTSELGEDVATAPAAPKHVAKMVELPEEQARERQRQAKEVAPGEQLQKQEQGSKTKLAADAAATLETQERQSQAKDVGAVTAAMGAVSAVRKLVASKERLAQEQRTDEAAKVVNAGVVAHRRQGQERQSPANWSPEAVEVVGAVETLGVVPADSTAPTTYVASNEGRQQKPAQERQRQAHEIAEATVAEQAQEHERQSQAKEAGEASAPERRQGEELHRQATESKAAAESIAAEQGKGQEHQHVLLPAQTSVESHRQIRPDVVPLLPPRHERSRVSSTRRAGAPAERVQQLESDRERRKQQQQQERAESEEEDERAAAVLAAQLGQVQSGLKRVAIQQAAVNRKLDSLITSVSQLTPSPRTEHMSGEAFDAAGISERTPDWLARAAVAVNPAVTLSPYVPTPAHSNGLCAARDVDKEAELIRKIQAMPVEALARLNPTQRATYDRVLQQHHHQHSGDQHSLFNSRQVTQAGRTSDFAAPGTEAEADLMRKVRALPVSALARLTPRQRAMYAAVMRQEQQE